MKALILAELVVTVLAVIAFLILYLSDPAGPANGDPRIRAARRHLIAATLVPGGEAFGLALLGFGVPVPIWLLAVCYGAGVAVMVHRCVLVIKARRASARG
jgi:hypothetical protein